MAPGGNVGIGSTTPTSFKLEVAGNIGPDATSSRDLGSASRFWNNLYVNNIIAPATGVNGYWQRAAGAISPANITDDILLGATATASARIKLGGTANAITYFNTGGNVGIGSTVPAALLDVKGASTGHTLVGIMSDATAYGAVGFASTLTSANYVIASNNSTETLINTPTGLPLKFRINNVDKMTLDSTGNVGIGSTTPTALFNVRNGAATPLANFAAGAVPTNDMVTVTNTGQANYCNRCQCACT